MRRIGVLRPWDENRPTPQRGCRVARPAAIQQVRSSIPARAGDIEPDAIARVTRRADGCRDGAPRLRIHRVVRPLRSRDNSARAGGAH
jgi:hypothetical protein